MYRVNLHLIPGRDVIKAGGTVAVEVLFAEHLPDMDFYVCAEFYPEVLTPRIKLEIREEIVRQGIVNGVPGDRIKLYLAETSIGALRQYAEQSRKLVLVDVREKPFKVEEISLEDERVELYLGALRERISQ